MDFVRMGNSGLKITEITFGSALTVGTERTDMKYAQRMVDTAWDCGIRSFDAANSYGNGMAETVLGKSLRKYPREEYIISTKAFWPMGDSVYHRGLSRKHLMWAFGESLKRLGLDYVDIFFAHRYDPDVPMLEIVRTFNHFIQTGRALYWATSEWPPEALRECHGVCERYNLEKPILEQFIYSYAHNKAAFNGVKDFCEQSGVGMQGFSPLCQGFLTGKYRKGVPQDSRIAKSQRIHYDKTANFYRQYGDRIDYFLSVADKFGTDGAHLALRWCIRNNVYPVLGASKPEQLVHNVRALEVNIPDEAWNLLADYSGSVTHDKA